MRKWWPTSEGSVSDANAPGLQQSPGGDFAMLYWEVEDLKLHRQQFKELMTSDEDFYAWSRVTMSDIFGFEAGQEQPPLPELLADSRVKSVEGVSHMHSIALAVPIKPGRTEAWKQYASDLSGKWRHEREEDYRRFGIHRALAWLQQTPNGDMAILYWEVEDPELHRQQFNEVMTSNDEYYVWVREILTDIFGLDPDQDRPSLPELIADYRVAPAETSA